MRHKKKEFFFSSQDRNTNMKQIWNSFFRWHQRNTIISILVSFFSTPINLVSFFSTKIILTFIILVSFWYKCLLVLVFRKVLLLSCLIQSNKGKLVNLYNVWSQYWIGCNFIHHCRKHWTINKHFTEQ